MIIGMPEHINTLLHNYTREYYICLNTYQIIRVYQRENSQI